MSPFVALRVSFLTLVEASSAFDIIESEADIIRGMARTITRIAIRMEELPHEDFAFMRLSHTHQQRQRELSCDLTNGRGLGPKSS